ncbi:MAG: hypothetical protein TECD_00158 [Hyphomicrobiaceae bacterium hypho_1]
MATNNAAAIWDIRNKFVLAAFLLFILFVVAGCSTGNESLLQAFSSPLTNTSRDFQSKRLTLAPQNGNIVIAPLIGPPDAVSVKLSTQVSTELTMRSINVVAPSQEQLDIDQSNNYTLRGYVVAASEAVGIKLSYIWDITNTSGERVHRITGENIINQTPSNDPWSSVSPQIISEIAKSAANRISKWWAQKSLQQSSSSLATITGTKKITLSADTKTVAHISSKKNNLETSKLAIHIPKVKGAPGDGSTSLSRALKRQLEKSGLTLVESPGKAAHTVEGNVKLGVAEAGKQRIKIDWIVKNSIGKKIGTVSQRNRIPAGSLDSQWGATADAAASAAAQGIIRLLPQEVSIARS